MFDRLLIAVDGSDCSTRAAKYGFELAARYGADVEVVSVFSGDMERAQAVLDAAADLATDVGIGADTAVLSGKPGRTIAARASERDADLVIVGRSGRAGVKERLLGSVAERVLRRSEVPVLTVPDGDLDSDTGADYADVLVTTDGSAVAEAAGPYAADIVRRYEAALHVLDVVDVQSEAGVFDAGGVTQEYVERLEADAREAVGDMLDGLDTADLDVREAVVRGAAGDTIVDYADDNDVGMIVMSSEGQSNLAGQQVGTVAGRVLRTAERPVLVVTSH
ncbi:Nucleotide-binding universal stress protein, UspA family [Haloplanus vescus]|uniref:Nucleotide-binding universal stress protein, UspA family n=1 Tax=Haloplanus vescus TaxID=555874 RepID=A0A1H3WHJ6_9EURY|nr:universal stress protein [Haloplanus vescus]SDZ86420.1 Nucleotide-binding universal stress protein, UspA family [Haloplanus vescus]